LDRIKKRYKYLILVFIIFSLSCSPLTTVLKFIQNKFKLEKKKDKKKDKDSKIKSKIKKDDKKETKKEKKKEEVIVYVDKEYLSSFYGKLSYKIVVKFLKDIKKKYRIKKIEKDFKEDKEITNFIVVSNKNFKKLNKTRPLFSEALYFLINREFEPEFKYPDSLKKMRVGVHYNSYVYNYINEKNPITGKKNYEIGDNFKIYAEFNNMIEDFRIKNIDIVMINRIEYYKLHRTLPSAFLFYIDIGKPFGYLYFKDKNFLKDFNSFLYKNRQKFTIAEND